MEEGGEQDPSTPSPLYILQDPVSLFLIIIPKRCNSVLTEVPGKNSVDFNGCCIRLLNSLLL